MPGPESGPSAAPSATLMTETALAAPLRRQASWAARTAAHTASGGPSIEVPSGPTSVRSPLARIAAMAASTWA